MRKFPEHRTKGKDIYNRNWILFSFLIKELDYGARRSNI